MSADVEGDFVVAWSSFANADQGSASAQGIDVERYHQFGNPVGSAILANTTAGGNQQDPSVAMGGQGQFYVSWTSNQGGGSEILMRPFNADGSVMNVSINGVAQTGEILVDTNDPTDPEDSYLSIATNLDGLELRRNLDQQRRGRIGRRRRDLRPGVRPLRASTASNSFALQSTGVFHVNTTLPGDQQYSAVAMSHQGNFVITWSGYGTAERLGHGRFPARGYTLTGNSGTTANSTAVTETAVPVNGVTGETCVNSFQDGNQEFASVASDADGNYVVVWNGPYLPAPLENATLRCTSSARTPVPHHRRRSVTGVTELDAQGPGAR